MDFIVSLFYPSNNTEDTFFKYESTTSNESINENPLITINSHIMILEDINFSPLPHSKEDKSIHNSNISNSLIKIIFNLDTIFQDKLKKKSSVNTSNNKLINSIKGVSNIMFEDSHYWDYLMRHFSNFESVKFINKFLLEKAFSNEKGLAWLSIIIFEKKLNEFLQSFYKSDFVKKYYEPDSLMIIKQKEMFEIAIKLTKISLNINIGIYNEYSKFIIEQNELVDIEGDIDIYHLVKKRSTNTIKGSNITQTATNDNPSPLYLTPKQSNNEIIKLSKFNNQVVRDNPTLFSNNITNNNPVLNNQNPIVSEMFKMNSSILISGINHNCYESKQDVNYSMII